MQVSISTALEAYRLLEDRQLIEARPQSGYYVRRLFNQSPRAGDYLGLPGGGHPFPDGRLLSGGHGGHRIGWIYPGRFQPSND